ncbi:ABC transporter substrate-binding protein [Mannheimia massilioguelmaensis]|uniref:ABC transporter substrate-binding protein n=1 Tax=Mannheimia massilioguelmaensis TaxID=1604354 RepID=UPI000696F60E|nr:ABC transporter substrate-binding protein [Mannheimia massilioguelmaensis]
MIHKTFKHILSILLFSNFIIPLAQARTVQDIENNPVEVAEQVNRIIDLWPANNQVVLLLGGADKLVGTVKPIKTNAWFAEIYPNIKNVPTLALGNDSNAESLLAQKPDVVLVSNKSLLNQVKQAGMTGILVMFQDFEGLKNTVKVTADVIGGNAHKIADEYIKELEGNIQLVRNRLKNIRDEQRPKVLHISNGTNLTKIDGGMSIVGEWIHLAGAKNAFEEQANLIDITLEDILKANPDIIIIGSINADKAVETIKSDPTWQNINAVKNGKVLINPLGTFPWDRYSAEEALQVLWAAKTFYPEKFEDVDMVKKTQQFYKKYYHYELSAENANQILNGLPPLQR